VGEVPLALTYDLHETGATRLLRLGVAGLVGLEAPPRGREDEFREPVVVSQHPFRRGRGLGWCRKGVSAPAFIQKRKPDYAYGRYNPHRVRPRPTLARGVPTSSSNQVVDRLQFRRTVVPGTAAGGGETLETGADDDGVGRVRDLPEVGHELRERPFTVEV